MPPTHRRRRLRLPTLFGNRLMLGVSLAHRLAIRGWLANIQRCCALLRNGMAVQFLQLLDHYLLVMEPLHMIESTFAVLDP